MNTESHYFATCDFFLTPFVFLSGITVFGFGAGYCSKIHIGIKILNLGGPDRNLYVFNFEESFCCYCSMIRCINMSPVAEDDLK